MNIGRFILLSLRRSVTVRFFVRLLPVFLSRLVTFVAVDNWMILFFFPAMALVAIHALRAASLLDTLYIFIFFPKLALYRLVVILFWISSKVLNIMGINTNRSIMVSSIRTPNCLISIKMKL